MEGKKGIYDIAEICRYHGVETAILCPGSRCAPLTLAFSRTSGILCHSIVDERSAAFVALGIAETSLKPVVLVCTSGSAVLNFAPALAEAYYRNIPLVVLTADRPRRLVNQHDGQTMNQPNVYANYIRESFDIGGEIHTADELAFLHSTVNAALIRAKADMGPVHVNIAFEEPLYHLAALEKQPRFISYFSEDRDELSHLENSPDSYGKWLVLVGSRKRNEAENQLLEQLASKIPVLAEAVSNTGWGSICNANEIIRFLREEEKTDCAPEVLVTLGDGIVSKNVKAFLRKYKPKKHIHISPRGEVIDTYQSLTDVWAMPVWKGLALLAEFQEKQNTDISFLQRWSLVAEQTKEKVEKLTENLPYGDMSAIHFVMRHLPKGVLLHVANSMSVRYVNIFADNFDGEIFCNRGTSGIDGSISTALGNAVGSGKRVWVITGDLSFQYDGNALWNNLPAGNMRIIVVNNSGGGIFRLIDGPSSVPEITERFETRIQSSARHKAEQYGLDYFSCHSKESLEEVWQNFSAEEGASKILEIFTSPEQNEIQFKSFIQQLSAK